MTRKDPYARETPPSPLWLRALRMLVFVFLLVIAVPVLFGTLFMFDSPSMQGRLQVFLVVLMLLSPILTIVFASSPYRSNLVLKRWGVCAALAVLPAITPVLVFMLISFTQS